MTVTNGRYKIVRKRVSSLKPSPENQQIYRALNDDPDIDGMVKSIKQIGLLDLPVITLDNYIVAGHRRHEALRRIGRVWVKCRQLQKRRDSMTRDEYIALLREHNRQRSKSVGIPSASRQSSGSLRSIVLTAICPSSRASGAPTQ